MQKNLDGTLKDFKTLRAKYILNPTVGYLNINSLRGDKFHHLKMLCTETPIEVLCVDETKLTADFPDAYFKIDGYKHPPFRRDRNDKLSTRGGGKIVFIRDGIIAQRLNKFETKTAETICIEITISGRKWFIVFAYRPESIDRKLFFDELNICLSLAATKYDHILLAGDLNVDMDIPKKDTKGFLSDICDTFDFSNLINNKTCHKSNGGASLDVLLTNYPMCFQHTSTIETGLSDHHKLVLTFLKSTFNRLPPKELSYRCYKNFNEENYLDDLKNLSVNTILNAEDPYRSLAVQVRKLVDEQAPLKTKKS